VVGGNPVNTLFATPWGLPGRATGNVTPSGIFVNEQLVAKPQAPPGVSPTFATAATYDPNGVLYTLNGNRYIFRATPSAVPALPGVATTLPAEDGNMLYGFDSKGRHVKTVTARTGAPVRQFGYDASGALASMTNEAGEVINITRIAIAGGSAVNITPIKTGITTTLTLDSNEFLTKFEQPAPVAGGTRTTWTSTHNDGKLTGQLDTRGFLHTYSYDSAGRVAEDTDGAGAKMTFSRSIAATSTGFGTPNAVSMVRTTQEGRQFTYKVQRSVLNDDLTLRNNARGNGWTSQSTNLDGDIETKSLLASETATSLDVVDTEVTVRTWASAANARSRLDSRHGTGGGMVGETA
jgi:YD repeat-containing protein